eukprot:gene6877-2632_t
MDWGGESSESERDSEHERGEEGATDTQQEKSSEEVKREAEKLDKQWAELAQRKIAFTKA